MAYSLLDAAIWDLMMCGFADNEILGLAAIRKRVAAGEHAVMESTPESRGLDYLRVLYRTARINEYGCTARWDAVLPRTPSGPQPGPSYSG